MCARTNIVRVRRTSGRRKRQPNVSRAKQALRRASLRTHSARLFAPLRFRAQGLGTSCQLIVGGAARFCEQLAALAGAVGVVREGQYLGMVRQFDSQRPCWAHGAQSLALAVKDEACQRMLAHLRLKAAGGRPALRFDDDVARDYQMCAIECDATRTGPPLDPLLAAEALHNEGIRRHAMCTWCA